MRILFYLCAVALFAVLSCSSEPVPGEPGAVITVNGRSVLGDDIRSTFEQHRGDSSAVNVLRDNILARELFLAHAVELGFDCDREVQRLVHERRREILQSAWLSSELDKEILPEGSVRDFWSDLGTGVRYTALTVSDSLLMDSISTLVYGGEDLTRLAEEFGMDGITRSAGGNIEITDRLYANVMDRDYLFDPVAGNVIGPFTAPAGYRILRIDSVWTYDPEPFEVDSASIGAMLLARQREIRKQFVEDSLKTGNNVTVNHDIIEIMAERGDGFEFEPFSDDELSMIAVSWDGGSRDVYSVSMNIVNLPGYLPRSTQDTEWLADYAERLAMFDIEMDMGLQAGLDTVGSIAKRLEVKELEMLLDHYYQEIIVPSLQPDSALLQEVYMEIRDDNILPESRVFSVLFLSGMDRIGNAREIMDSGDDMIESAENFDVFPPLLAEGDSCTTIPITRAMVPEDDREALFSMDINDEIIVDLSDSTALWFRLLSVNPERTPELDEIRERVFSNASQRIEIETIGGLVDSLEAAYHPYVDYAFFSEFYIPAEPDTISTAGDTQGVTDAL